MRATGSIAAPSPVTGLTVLQRLVLGTLVALGALMLDFAVPGEVAARGQNGFCEVYRGKKKLDANPCLAREICYYNQTRRSELCRTEYLWSTKATTLVTYDKGVPTQVNGAPAKVRTLNGRTCALNTVSGNTFCYRRR